MKRDRSVGAASGKHPFFEFALDVLRILFPAGQGHARLALIIAGAGGLLVAGPHIVLLIAAGICPELAGPQSGFCAVLQSAATPQYGVGFALILLAVAVYFGGALLAKPRNVVVKDDYLGFDGGGLTLELACAIVRKKKRVPVSFRNLKSGEKQLRLQSMEFSGDGPDAVLGKIIAGLEGGPPAGLTHWFENEHFYVGRRDS